MKVFIVGAGTMGAGIAQTFLQHDHTVWLYDTVDAAVQSGYKKITAALQAETVAGIYKAEQVEKWLDNIHLATSLDLAADADLVVEAIFEHMSVKQEVFQELDDICSAKTLLATNTSALSITEISCGLEHAANVCGMHFFNPAPKTPLIEVVPGMLTQQSTVEAIQRIAHSIGKETVTMQESAGFIVNRLVIPQINEAVFLLMEGVATAADIDKAMILGANHHCGPLHLADSIGNDAVLQIMETLLSDTGDVRYRPCPLLRKMVRANLLGRKTGQGFFKY